MAHPWPAWCARPATSISMSSLTREPDRDGSRRPQSRQLLSPARRLSAWAFAILGPPLITWALLSWFDAPLHNVLLVYLLAAVGAGVLGGALPAAVTAISGFFLANWFFTPPVRSWTINSADNLFSLFAFLFVSLVVGLLVGLSSRRTAEGTAGQGPGRGAGCHRRRGRTRSSAPTNAAWCVGSGRPSVWRR